MRLIDKLNRLGQTTKGYCPDVNNGGCAIFATLVGRALLAKGIVAQVIVASRWAHPDEQSWVAPHIDKVRKEIRRPGNVHDWNINSVFFDHVGVEFIYNGTVWHYDTDGVHSASKKLDNLYIYPGRLRVREAGAIAGMIPAWNDQFPRSQIPTIKQLVNKYLN